MVISVEAREFKGDNWLIVRYWDGFDKPEYFPVTRITRDELDFSSGRFNLCDPNYTNPNSHDFYILIVHQLDIIEPYINWISDNINHTWRLAIEGGDFIHWKISFSNRDDAILFKLTWPSVIQSVDELIRDKYS